MCSEAATHRANRWSCVVVCLLSVVYIIVYNIIEAIMV